MGTHGVGNVSVYDGGVNLWTAGMLLMYAGEKIRVEGRGHVMLSAWSGILVNSGRQASSLWLGGRQDWLAPYTGLRCSDSLKIFFFQFKIPLGDQL